MESELTDPKNVLDEIESDATLRAEILARAIEVVKIVEESKQQKDLNSAKLLVEKIEDSKEKLAILNRLQAIQSEIKFEWIKVRSTWYYMTRSGAMQTGWIKLGRSWYYTNTSGAMQTGSLRIGGRNYRFDSSGRMK